MNGFRNNPLAACHEADISAQCKTQFVAPDRRTAPGNKWEYWIAAFLGMLIATALLSVRGRGGSR